MKIYTRKGDTGETSLLGGTRVSKAHLRIDAYGNVDELNSWIGLIRDQPLDSSVCRFLIGIQENLFTLGSILACDPSKENIRIPALTEKEITSLESAIDQMSEELPEMKSFILPGGHPSVSYCHIARCICRKAERGVVRLAEQEKVDDIVIRYLNRLSDYLFILSRKVSHDLKAGETPWNPRA